MKIVDLVLLRHGAPELQGTFLGQLDSAPTPEGIADCVAAVAGMAFGRIVTSPLRRAVAAAEAIAAAADMEVQVDPQWRELDFGDWDGRSYAELTPDHAPALKAFWKDPDADAPPGGERWSAICARVSAAIGDIVGEDDGTDNEPPVLVVAHGGSMRAALAVLCGFGFADTMRIDLPYAAVLRLKIFVDGDAPPSAVIRGLH